ncbi:MAG: class I SAM-dependent methyltransferase [Clostridia bacterium]|nr:class I SAM-dependent methyltransferase [Clostridia bacterium]
MNSINKTLFIPLYGKALVSQKGIILSDKKAEEIWASQEIKLKAKSKSKWLAYYMGMRSEVFDDWLNQKLKEFDGGVVIHIGCGLDSRVLRVNSFNRKWYDLDFLEVINERKKYYNESKNYQMIAGDASEISWLENIKESDIAFVVMEGVSMYLDDSKIKQLFNSLGEQIEKVFVLMDCYTTFAAKMSKYKNPINEVGVTKVYGIDQPKLLENGGVCFLQELDMTPEKYINELNGFEKRVFKKLYAGRFAKKLYKLYEYKKG